MAVAVQKRSNTSASPYANLLTASFIFLFIRTEDLLPPSLNSKVSYALGYVPPKILPYCWEFMQ